MNKHRIPMSASMIQAIQREIERPGTGKTQTRRVVKPQPEHRENESVPGNFGTFFHGWNLDHPAVRPSDYAQYSPYGQPGDLLAFTETFAFGRGYDELPPGELPDWTADMIRRWYRADEPKPASARGRWRQARFMPYWCSRYTGVVTDVRVERMQEISEDEAAAEGIEYYCAGLWRDYRQGEGIGIGNPIESFAGLWDSIHGPGAWARNDWVWVYTFRPFEANVLNVERDPAAYGVGEVVA